jgi:hypothetical protein
MRGLIQLSHGELACPECFDFAQHKFIEENHDGLSCHPSTGSG